ncbi:hypothetical protein PENARI_c003G01657 [Penicillium arizonense]|uniref:BZIP domain-containing protein n=1 Tax=Penicillium arizonense TaxID=1835702 RepID=A0A1F5LT28_PENAI|nr:hypothetical protein PENARI_c003G01657 [Penicillium arizonense]OGE56246.1 hypothetical protein PENARI_c003G01657 [Penicillium arizonense]
MEVKNSGNAKDDPARSAASRIRENQRRSRTRRKEYVQHLEQRLWSFERLGVAATQEVQEAGRKVARENEVLRSLLLLHGVTEKSVEEYLESRGQPTSSTLSQCMSLASLESAKLHPPTAPNQRTSSYHHSPATSSHWQSDNPPHQPRAIGSRNTSPKSDAKTNMDILPCQEFNTNRAAKLNPVTAESNSETHEVASVQDTGQSMSCVTAARIIENMQNHSEYRDVRSELGCSSEPTCMKRELRGTAFFRQRRYGTIVETMGHVIQK